MKRKIIGITLDWEDSKTYSSHSPWYALRENYIRAISKAGGASILIPYDAESLESYIDVIDGLVIPGGDYDLDPSSYNAKTTDKVRTLKQNRVKFEMALLEAAVKKKIPILGICAGMQLIAVKYGGTLYQDIPLEHESDIIHEQKHSHHETSHDIGIKDGTLLHRITGAKQAKINSTHHQAVKTLGKEFIVSAVAPDGIIEAIEHKTYPFLLGVEWHPEYEISSFDTAIFQGFLQAVKGEL